MEHGSGAPLSLGQQAVWLSAQYFPGRGLYNIHFALRLPKGMDLQALRRAAEQLSTRHAALRTTFTIQDGAPVQRVHDTLAPTFRHVQTTAAGDRALEQRMLDETSQSLDLEKGPPVCWTVFSAPGLRSILLFTVSHLVMDGTSCSAVLPELGELYCKETGGNGVLPDLSPSKYIAFVKREQTWLETPAAQEARAFWNETLKGHIPLADLPTDRPRPANPSFDAGCLAFPIPADLQTRMHALTRDLSVRPLTLWLSAWFVLLHRLSNAEDLVATLPVSLRGRRDNDDYGHFVNTLPVRVPCAKETPFRTFVQSVAEAVRSGLAHKRWPFLHMTQETARDNLPALSQTSFNWDNYTSWSRLQTWSNIQIAMSGAAGEAYIVDGEAWERLWAPQQRDETDIQIRIINFPEGQYGVIQYASDLFDRATIERWANHFVTLLEEIVTDPARPLSRLPLLKSEEERRILVEWNNTKTPYPRALGVHQVFEEHAARAPDATALILEDERVSYGALNARANQLARRLQALGVGPEVRVGLCLERSIEMIVGLLAILKAGGAYVPLDPNYPQDRLAFMAEDAALKVLICHNATQDRLPPCQAHVLNLDTEHESIAALNSSTPDCASTSGALAPNALAPNALAYVIYTSGSTGKPKGVMIEHGGLTNLALHQKQAFGITPQDRVLQFASISFDASLEQIFCALTAGAALVLRGAQMWTAEECLAVIARQGVTVVEFPPVYLAQVLEAASPQETARTSLRLLVTGGEALPVSTVSLLKNLNLPLRNTYGPTETSISVTAREVNLQEDTRGWSNSVPIGRPFSNMRAYILDDHRRPAPIGVAGELHIGGVGVARGYLNRPDLTAEKFIPDPFSDQPGARMYRTGDLCRYLPDGDIEYLGRIDTQVKVRGFRIECGEVENALLNHDAVRQAAVDARTIGDGDKRLIAWIAAEKAAEKNADLDSVLRDCLKQTLPEWMVPAAFITLDSLPLTPSGKIDRKALPNPEASAFSRTRTYVAPRTPMEETLAGIWASVLGLERVGVQDDFFDLGGHSLLATRVISQVRAQLGIELPLKAIFEHSTIEALAQAAAQQQDWSPSVLVPLRADGSQAPLFCIHPVGGSAFCYRELTTRLNSEQPVYGLQAVGFDSDEAPLASIEAMAARYLEEIEATWPDGPYNLYGWSFGGVVAFEMARRLQAAGKPVTLLALADTGHPARADMNGVEEASDDVILLYLLAEAGAVDGDAIRRLQALPSEQQLEACRKVIEAADSPLARLDVKDLSRFLGVYRANLQALKDYDPQPGGAPIAFFSAQERLDNDPEALDLPWRPLTPRIEVHPTPGNHFTMHQGDGARRIATVLGAALRDRPS